MTEAVDNACRCCRQGRVGHQHRQCPGAAARPTRTEAELTPRVSSSPSIPRHFPTSKTTAPFNLCSQVCPTCGKPSIPPPSWVLASTTIRHPCNTSGLGPDCDPQCPAAEL